MSFRHLIRWLIIGLVVLVLLAVFFLSRLGDDSDSDVANKPTPKTSVSIITPTPQPTTSSLPPIATEPPHTPAPKPRSTSSPLPQPSTPMKVPVPNPSATPLQRTVRVIRRTIRTITTRTTTTIYSQNVGRVHYHDSAENSPEADDTSAQVYAEVNTDN